MIFALGRGHQPDAAWQATLAYANSEEPGLREYGFWVFGYGDGRIEAGPQVAGAVFDYDADQGSIQLGESYDLRSNTPDNSSCKFMVAMFHTHPPLHRSPPNCRRTPGPSKYDDPGDCVGIVYDYDNSEVVGGIDYSDVSLKAYHYGPDRREEL